MKNKSYILTFALLILMVVPLISCLTTTSSDKTDQTSSGTLSQKMAKSLDSQDTVQVLLSSTENLSNTESAWLPGQIQDRLKSNMQEYLGMRTVVDSNAEKSLKQLQAESESSARDENTAIELGKITTAKFGLFSKIRKTGSGYSISVDYTDLTTGVQVASATSKEYSKAEYLYGSTGAVDEVTLALANKLNIQLNDLTKNLLASGSADFSVEAQMALAKQNEEQYQKLMKQYDDELKKLSVSNDLSAVENKKKIEAEKALLAEKQKSEQKRLAELAAQKQQAESDTKLEAERSIELKTQRDNLAAQAAAKAAEVRRLKLDKQGVLGQINVIESKKKALVEIRQAVEVRYDELYNQMNRDKKVEEDKIRNVPWSIVELKDGKPTESAKQGRDNLVAESNRNIENKFIADCESVARAADSQDTGLMSEIRSDSSKLAVPRKVNSLGDELKVSYGTYDGEKYGWVAYLSIYSDGINYYNDQFIVDYKSLTGKPAPDITTANKQTRDEYIANTDMYNSLLTRGNPILYFELDYSVKAENDDKPSQYVFNFDIIHVFNTVTGKEVQTTKLGKSISKTMVPEQDIRKNDIVKLAKTKLKEDNAKQIKLKQMLANIKDKKYNIFDKDFYNLIIENDSATGASLFDAMFFCNKLSMILGYNPYYVVNGTTDITKWNYNPNLGQTINKKIEINKDADGYRLPTYEECNNESNFGAFINRIDSNKWFYPQKGTWNCYSIEMDSYIMDSFKEVTRQLDKQLEAMKITYGEISYQYKQYYEQYQSLKQDYYNRYFNNYNSYYYPYKPADTYRHTVDRASSMLKFDFVRNKMDGEK